MSQTLSISTLLAVPLAPLVSEISWAQILGAALVIAAGKFMVARASHDEPNVVDLAAEEQQTKSS